MTIDLTLAEIARVRRLVAVTAVERSADRRARPLCRPNWAEAAIAMH